MSGEDGTPTGTEVASAVSCRCLHVLVKLWKKLAVSAKRGPPPEASELVARPNTIFAWALLEYDEISEVVKKLYHTFGFLANAKAFLFGGITKDKGKEALHLAMENHECLRQLQSTVKTIMVDMEWLGLETIYETTILHVNFLLKKLDSFDVLEDGTLAPKEAAKAWAEQVLNFDGGLEECLFDIHSLVVGNSVVFANRPILDIHADEVVRHTKQMLAGGKDPKQSIVWKVETFANTLAGLQSSAFLAYCAALNVLGRSDEIPPWNTLKKEHFKAQAKSIANTLKRVNNGVYFYPFPVQKAHSRILPSIYLGKSENMGHHPSFDLHEVVADGPMCGIRLYKREGRVAISVQGLTGLTAQFMTPLDKGIGREWTSNVTAKQIHTMNTAYIFEGWMRVPDPKKQCIRGVAFYELQRHHVGLRILVVEKSDIGGEKSKWVYPRANKGNMAPLAPKHWFAFLSHKSPLKVADNVVYTEAICPDKNGYLTGIRLSVLYRKKGSRFHFPVGYEAVLGVELETGF